MTERVEFRKDQVAVVEYCLLDLIARRRLSGRTVPREVESLLRHLHTSSVGGTGNSSGAEEFDTDGGLIDTGAAAELLGCSTRWVRRIRTDLDGRKLSGRWVFRRQTVIDYADARREGL